MEGLGNYSRFRAHRLRGETLNPKKKGLGGGWVLIAEAARAGVVRTPYHFMEGVRPRRAQGNEHPKP